MEHADPSKRPFIEEFDRRYPLDPDSPVGSPQVIRSGEPLLMAETPEGLWEQVAQDPEHLRLLREIDIVSSLVVPLRVRNEVIGDIALAMSISGRRYGEEDLRHAQQLADRCALAIDNARLFTELREARDELSAILEGVADAVLVQQPDGRLVYANDAAVRLLGYPDAATMLLAETEELRGRFRPRDELGAALPVATLPGRRALVGEQPEPLTVRYRHPDGSDRWARMQARPVRGEDGAVRVAITVIEDITELKRAEFASRFLAEASRALTASLDLRGMLEHVASLAVPAVADRCVIELVEGDDVRLVVAGEAPEGAVELREPMWAHSGVVGELKLAAARDFDEHDRELIEDLAVRIASAVENARLYETASSIAKTLQRSLLPPSLPELEGVEMAAAFRPAGRGYEVGGDFYDVFGTAADDWFVVIGDVCGKGAEAAAVTALARYTIRAAAVRLRSPKAILQLLSDAMILQSEGRGRFCTIACAHVEFGRVPARVTVACGGHPLPLLLRAGGSVELVGVPGTLLGLVPDPQLDERSAELAPGDTLVLYTDGLTEAGAPERVWSDDDLAAAAAATDGRSAAETVQQLVDAALGPVPVPRDDVAVLALRALG